MGLLPAVQTAMLDCWWIFHIRVVALWIQDAHLDCFWRVPLAQRFEANKALFSGRTQNGILASHADLIPFAFHCTKKLPPCKALLNCFVHILPDGSAPCGLVVFLSPPLFILPLSSQRFRCFNDGKPILLAERIRKCAYFGIVTFTIAVVLLSILQANGAPYNVVVVMLSVQMRCHNCLVFPKQ